MDEVQVSAVKDESRPTFPAVIATRDESLTTWLDQQYLAVGEAERGARLLKVTDKDSMEQGVAMKRNFKAGSTLVSGFIKPYKQRLDDIKNQILDVEKALAGGYDKASEVVMTKINTYLNEVEALRLAEEKRLRELAEKEREKRLTQINAALDKLLEKKESLADQRAALEEQLNAEGNTLEETEILKARISAIDAKIGMTSTKIEDKQTQIEQTANPLFQMSVPMPETVKGMSTTVIWEVEQISNKRLVLQAVLDNLIPMACVDINEVKVKQAGNDQVRGQKNVAPNIPGVVFRQKRDTRVR